MPLNVNEINQAALVFLLALLRIALICSMYEDMAYGVLSECYKRDSPLARQLLVRQLDQYSHTTVFSLADTHELMKFMGHTCCQTKLDLLWKGKMAYTHTLKVGPTKANLKLYLIFLFKQCYMSAFVYMPLLASTGQLIKVCY